MVIHTMIHIIVMVIHVMIHLVIHVIHIVIDVNSHTHDDKHIVIQRSCDLPPLWKISRKKSEVYQYELLWMEIIWKVHSIKDQSRQCHV
jgi:hypothetical protein